MSDDSEWESIFITQSTYNVDGTTDKANDTDVILSNLLNLEGKKRKRRREFQGTASYIIKSDLFSDIPDVGLLKLLEKK